LHHFCDCFIPVGNPATEEFNDADHFGAHQNGKAEPAAQSFLDGKVKSRKVFIRGQVANP
jgi:hypothetical protein